MTSKQILHRLSKLDKSKKYFDTIDNVKVFSDDVLFDFRNKYSDDVMKSDLFPHVLDFILLDFMFVFYSERLHYWSTKYSHEKNTKVLYYHGIMADLVEKYNSTWDMIKNISMNDPVEEDQMSEETDLEDGDSEVDFEFTNYDEDGSDDVSEDSSEAEDGTEADDVSEDGSDTNPDSIEYNGSDPYEWPIEPK